MEDYSLNSGNDMLFYNEYEDMLDLVHGISQPLKSKTYSNGYIDSIVREYSENDEMSGNELFCIQESPNSAVDELSSSYPNSPSMYLDDEYGFPEKSPAEMNKTFT